MNINNRYKICGVEAKVIIKYDKNKHEYRLLVEYNANTLHNKLKELDRPPYVTFEGEKIFELSSEDRDSLREVYLNHCRDEILKHFMERLNRWIEQ